MISVKVHLHQVVLVLWYLVLAVILGLVVVLLLLVWIRKSVRLLGVLTTVTVDIYVLVVLVVGVIHG